MQNSKASLTNTALVVTGLLSLTKLTRSSAACMLALLAGITYMQYELDLELLAASAKKQSPIVNQNWNHNRQ
ncbi:hypothetical protein L2E82_48303 [Cichorium intybus]|uniref:Uncharacterized protein n=1 Tax=Cichorium intybus TaxID=13427 RepID=A0ACB8YYD8_CICIN|nr:hypothetical protein L2E82_48303 [Cichorium intybus]